MEWKLAGEKGAILSGDGHHFFERERRVGSQDLAIVRGHGIRYRFGLQVVDGLAEDVGAGGIEQGFKLVIDQAEMALGVFDIDGCGGMVHNLLQLGLRLTNRLLGILEVGDIDAGQDDALTHAGDGEERQDAQQEPGPGLRGDCLL